VIHSSNLHACRQLLALEARGIRSCTSTDEISHEVLRCLRSASVVECRALLKEILTLCVRQYINVALQGQQTKQLEAQIKTQESIIKSLMSQGISSTDRFSGVNILALSPLPSSSSTMPSNTPAASSSDTRPITAPA
jgi:hypothetical protein